MSGKAPYPGCHAVADCRRNAVHEADDVRLGQLSYRYRTTTYRPGTAVRVGAVLVVLAVVSLTGCEEAPGTVMPGDAARGAMLFRQQCAACHSVEPGLIREGPSLHGVIGARAGSVPGFHRYTGLRGSEVVWTPETLDRWLADPKRFLDGRTTTKTVHVNHPDDRADIIAFLATGR